jgi:hypothetical protein
MNVKSAVFECGSVRTAVYVGLGAHQIGTEEHRQLAFLEDFA